MQRLKALVRLEKDTVLALQQALNGAGQPFAIPGQQDPDSAALVVSNTSTSQTWEVQPFPC